ncbi:MAG: DUF1587 domain-containing protein, partial [Pirellulaceae bacterium]|nr:DUF1587 domain-containing protein [Pirellulaceae bacterium]
MGLISTGTACAAPPEAGVDFLKSNCLDCHDGKAAEAEFDLRKIGSDLSQPNVMAHWIKAFDRVQAGEMPPEDAGEVDEQEKREFLGVSGKWIRDYQLDEQAELGRVRARRLTNVQLERTLQDLLAVDVPLASLMPEEQRVNGFKNIADGQSISHFQLETHLQVVDAALDAAFARAADTDDLFEKQMNAREIARENPRRRCREPEMLDGKAVVWNGGPIFYGRINSATVRQSGWYRFTLVASALNPPEDQGVWCSVRSGLCTSGAPLLSWIGSFEATSEPKEVTFEAWIPRGHMLEVRPADATLRKAKFANGQVGAGEGTPQNVAGLALHSLTIQQVHPGGDVRTVRARLFGKDVAVTVDRRSKELSIKYKNPAQDAAKQVRSFARRAFRRSVDEQSLQPYLKLLRESMDAGQPAAVALQATYRAILCSPRF